MEGTTCCREHVLSFVQSDLADGHREHWPVALGMEKHVSPNELQFVLSNLPGIGKWVPVCHHSAPRQVSDRWSMPAVRFQLCDYWCDEDPQQRSMLHSFAADLHQYDAEILLKPDCC